MTACLAVTPTTDARVAPAATCCSARPATTGSADRLTGGKEFNVLTGGFGADVFIFVFDWRFSDDDRVVEFECGIDTIDISGMFAGTTVTPDRFAEFVRVTPLGPTELTGFIAVDRNGAGSQPTFQIIAQIDGPAFEIVNDLSRSTLTVANFIIG